MNDEVKTKKQLIDELARVRQWAAEWEAIDANRKQKEEFLYKDTEKYRDLLDNANDLIQSVDKNGKFIYVNRKWLETLNYTEDEVKDLTLWDILHKNEINHFREVFQTVSRGNNTKLIETKFVSKNGEVISAEGNINAVLKRGIFVATQGIFRDITRRKQTQKSLRESEERYRLFSAMAKEIILVLDMQGHITYVNKPGQDISGYSKEEILQMKVDDVLAPECLDELENRRARRLAGYRGTYLYETVFISKSGQRIAVEVNTTPYMKHGKYSGILAVARDVTQRKKAERALKESEEKYRNLVEEIREAMFTTDLNGNVNYTSPAIVPMSGYHPSDTMGHNFSEFVFKDDLPALSKLFQKVISGEIQICEIRVRKKSGNVLWVRVSAYPIVENNHVVGVRGVISDITTQKETETALKESESSLKLAQQLARFGNWEWDLESNTLKMSDEMCHIYGIANGDQFPSIRSVANTFVHPKDKDKINKLLDDVAIGYDGQPLTYQIIRPDGEKRWLAATKPEIRLVNPDGKPKRLIGAVQDITELKKAEEAIKETEERFRRLSEASFEGIVIHDRGAILDSNQAFADMFGYEPNEVIGMDILDMVIPQCHDIVLSNVLSGYELPYEAVGLRKDGSVFSGELHGKSIPYLGNMVRVTAIRDTTERKKTQEQIMRHYRELNVLNELSRSLARVKTTREVLRTGLNNALEVLSMSQGSAYLFDENTQQLNLIVHTGISEQSAKRGRKISGNSRFANLSFGTGQVFSIKDIELDEQINNELREALSSEKIRSIACIPLTSQNKVRGILCIGKTRPIDLTSDEIRLMGTIGDYVGLAIEKSLLIEQMSNLSITDDLTGVYNRRHFYEILDTEINRVQRYKNHSCLALLDLNGFKEFNDLFGHTNGDEVLRSFAQTLMSILRKSDKIFRYGGDEFAIILPSTQAERAQKLIERIRQAWEQSTGERYRVDDSVIGFSAGIAQMPQDAKNRDSLILIADTALYYAKSQGGSETIMASEMALLVKQAHDMGTQDQARALAAMVDARDALTAGHPARVASIATKIGTAVGIKQEELSELLSASLLHDIGKVGVPYSILAKPGKLTGREWRRIKKHPSEGAKIIGHIEELSGIVPMILHHHEWYDGTGYPDGLGADEIPIGAKIISIADAYDAMTTERHYREPITHIAVVDQLKARAGTQFDPKLVEVFCQTIVEPQENGKGEK